MLQEIVIKLFEWPFLAFVLLIAFTLLFRQQIMAILSRGNITISWGDKSIKLGELSESLDKELDPIRIELEEVKKTVASLNTNDGKPESKGTEEDKKDAHERMKSALTSTKWRWRTIERLAAIGLVSESEASDILRSDPEVEFGRDKSGNPIAKLKAR